MKIGSVWTRRTHLANSCPEVVMHSPGCGWDTVTHQLPLKNGMCYPKQYPVSGDATRFCHVAIFPGRMWELAAGGTLPGRCSAKISIKVQQANSWHEKRRWRTVLRIRHLSRLEYCGENLECRMENNVWDLLEFDFRFPHEERDTAGRDTWSKQVGC